MDFCLSAYWATDSAHMVPVLKAKVQERFACYSFIIYHLVVESCITLRQENLSIYCYVSLQFVCRETIYYGQHWIL